jgi:hypothetical protein
MWYLLQRKWAVERLRVVLGMLNVSYLSLEQTQARFFGAYAWPDQETGVYF